jgi:HTH-type transcriptional regulator/antitoxin HigA
MDLRIIKTEKEYQNLLDWVDEQFNLNVAPDSEDGQNLQMALLLIKQYEDVHYVISFPNPIEISNSNGKEIVR